MSRRLFQKSGLICFVLLICLSLSFSFAFAVESKKIPLRIIFVKNPQEAKVVLSKLKKGVPFMKLAAERSHDKSKGKSGDLGTVDISRLEPPLRKAVAKMKEGDISGAIRLKKNRYAIVQVVDFSHYRKGAAAFRAGDFDSAEKDLREHLRQNPDGVKARIMLGDIHDQKKEFEKAEAAYKDVLSYDLKSWVAYVRLGKLYMQNARYQKAREIYAQGLKYIPKAEGFRTGLKDAEARLAAAPAQEAEAPPEASPKKEAAPAPAVTPPAPQAAEAKVAPPAPAAESVSRVKATPAARTIPAVKPARTPGDERSMHLRMIVLGSAAAAEEVISDLKKGRSFGSVVREKSIDEKNRAESGYLGEVRLDSLDTQVRDAVRNLKTGQTSRPVKLDEGRYAVFQAADFHYLKEGENAFIEEDFKTAEKKLLKHLELNEDDAGAYLMLGHIYEGTRRLQKAEEMYKKGISYHPRTVLLYLRLGKLYQMQKQFQKSKDVFVEGFRNVPNSELLAKGIEMVDVLLFNESRESP